MVSDVSGNRDKEGLHMLCFLMLFCKHCYTLEIAKDLLVYSHSTGLEFDSTTCWASP